jgi:Xaa-Pro aminopeptidase
MKSLPSFLVACLVAGAAAPAAAQITTAEYAARRDSLAARLQNGVLIAFGGRTPVTDFGPFYQLPAFRYLTGYEFADAALIMVVKGGQGRSTLFVKRTEPRRSLYYGLEPDSATLARDLGLASRPIEQIGPVADSLATTGTTVHTLRDYASFDFQATDSLTRGGEFIKGLTSHHPGLVVKDAHPILNQLRARKSDAEMALIRKAAEISAAGHSEAMRRVEPGMKEYDLQAVVEYAFRRGGAERPSYGAIVGSGPLSLQLHYMKDRREIQPGDVIVLDAGAEYHGYAADVTRTLPINGTYTPEQRQIYQIVRDAQAAAERNSKVGLTMAAALDSSVDVRAKGLAALGLIESPTATFDPPWPVDCSKNPRPCEQVSLFAIHGITHGLGLEVHDPMQGYFGPFKIGDAFTIEPGLYISHRLLDLLPDTPKNRSFIAKVKANVAHYENTGVRIEDSYLITDRGTEWISKAPRDLDEVEAMLKRRAIP